jgi:hypothetical protein
MSRFLANAAVVLISLLAARGATAEGERVLAIEGIEVTQAIQSLDQDVPLIAGKPTVVRVYLSMTGVGPLNIRGRLLGSRQADAEIESINIVRFSIADNLSLQQKRSNAVNSLNFLLPPEWIVEGHLKLRVSSLSEASEIPIACSNCSTRAVEVELEKDAPLRIRLLGVRYRLKNSEVVIAPTDSDFKLAQSWLRRAYPVAQVISSVGTLEADTPWPFDCNAVNAQLSAARALDIDGGIDPRTHYYGIVSDNKTESFMRGCASGIPSGAEPATVASGPAGSSSFGWDEDGSYADWYTAHELAHTLGRKHPGFCDGNSKDDNSYPFPQGSLSEGDKYMGWDFGDPGVLVKMQALGGSEWHDIMTYCDREWLSRYTYLGIRQRLLAEEKLLAGGVSVPAPAPAGVTPSPGSRGRELVSSAVVHGSKEAAPPEAREGAQGVAGAEPGEVMTSAAGAPEPGSRIEEGIFVNVVATLNLTKKTGKIKYVNPVSKGVGSTAGMVRSLAVIRLKRANGEQDINIQVPVKVDTDRNDAGEDTGLVDALVPLSGNVIAMELLWNEILIDSKSFGQSAPSIKNLTIDSKESRQGFALFRRTATGPTILLWDGADADGDKISYSVQKSSDLGKTWETLAVGLHKPELELERDPRESPVGIMFRIIANDGINSTYATTTEPVQKVPEPGGG